MDAFEPKDAFFTKKAFEPQPTRHLFGGLMTGSFKKILQIIPEG